MGKKAIKIGYLMQTGAPDMSTLSGPQLHVSATIKGLQRLGHQVRTVAIQNKQIVWSDDLRNWRVPRFGLSHRRWFRLMERLIRRVQSEIRLPYLGFFESFRFADACYHLLQAYDVLYERHGWMGYGSVIAARWLGLPLVEELNGNIIKQIEIHGFQLSPIQWKLSQWLTYRTFFAADHIVVVSEALKNQLVTGLGMPEEKISVVLNGANVDLFTQPHNEKQIRERYDIGSHTIVTFVGSFQPWHGVELLVSSFKKVQARFPESQLIIIGDGAGEKGAARQIDSLGLQANIKLLGRLPQDEVAAVLSISDVAVAPYPLENTEIVGTPLKLIEYMAAGKAIVASTAPIHEVIADGITGLRVAPAKAEALAEAISRLLGDKDLRARLETNAWRQAQSYSWDNVTQELSEILIGKVSDEGNALLN